MWLLKLEQQRRIKSSQAEMKDIYNFHLVKHGFLFYSYYREMKFSYRNQSVPLTEHFNVSFFGKVFFIYKAVDTNSETKCTKNPNLHYSQTLWDDLH